MKLFGIANCNTVKKARAWLDEHHIAAEFHDFKKLGVNEPMLRDWIAQVGWENLLNRKGTTWRQLPDEIKTSIRDEAGAIRLMLEKPSAIKRPVVERGSKVAHIGFDETTYQTLFGK
jgi:Spx/MgsR family transcriptional regulator